MSEEEINRLLARIEQDKLIDRCGFEFADGGSCTFENTAICYDDRLKLYYIVKKLQQENQQLKENNLSMQEEMCRSWEKVDLYKSVIDEVRELLGHFECGQLCECTQELAIHVLEILDKANKESE